MGFWLKCPSPLTNNRLLPSFNPFIDVVLSCNYNLEFNGCSRRILKKTRNLPNCHDLLFIYLSSYYSMLHSAM